MRMVSVSQPTPRQAPRWARTQSQRRTRTSWGAAHGGARWLTLLSTAIVVVVSLPLAYLVLRASSSGWAGAQALLQPRTVRIFTNSLLLTGIVVGASAAIGLVFAWLTTRTNLPYRRVILVLGLLPMVIPSYIGALTLLAAFGPVGVLQQWLAPLGVRRLPEIYGLFGASLTITLFTYPYFVLPVRAALLAGDRAVDECAATLGCSGWSAFWRVTLPTLRPAMAVGALLTALYTLSDFGAVMVMRYNAFARAIYVTYNSSFDRSRAALLALVLVAVTLVLVWLSQRMTARLHMHRVGKGVQRAPARVPLGLWTLPALLFCATLIGVGVLVPVGVLLGWALNPHVGTPYATDFTRVSVQTVGTSAAAALVVGLAALPVALVARPGASGYGRVLGGLATVGNALPGVVIGLALVFFGANGAPWLYQTMPLLILGYTMRFLPYGVESTRSALAGISPALEEAAQSLGAGRWGVLWRVTVPLAWASIVGGMALVFLNAMKELPTTLMLAPIGFRTLATRIWSATDSGTMAWVGLPGLLLIALSSVGLAIVLWREQRAAR